MARLTVKRRAYRGAQQTHLGGLRITDMETMELRAGPEELHVPENGSVVKRLWSMRHRRGSQNLSFSPAHRRKEHVASPFSDKVKYPAKGKDRWNSK